MQHWSLMLAMEDSLVPQTAAREKTERARALAAEASAEQSYGSLAQFADRKPAQIKEDIREVLGEYGNILPRLYEQLSWKPFRLAEPPGFRSARPEKSRATFVKEWPYAFGPAEPLDKRGSLDYAFGWFVKPVVVMDTHPYPQSFAEDILRSEIKTQRQAAHVPNWEKKRAAGKWDYGQTFAESLDYSPKSIDIQCEPLFCDIVPRSPEELAAYDTTASELLLVVKSIEIFLEEYRRVISGWAPSDAFLKRLGLPVQPPPKTVPGRSGIHYNRFWLSRR